MDRNQSKPTFSLSKDWKSFGSSVSLWLSLTRPEKADDFLLALKHLLILVKMQREERQGQNPFKARPKSTTNGTCQGIKLWEQTSLQKKTLVHYLNYCRHWRSTNSTLTEKSSLYGFNAYGSDTCPVQFPCSLLSVLFTSWEELVCTHAHSFPNFFASLFSSNLISTFCESTCLLYNCLLVS